MNHKPSITSRPALQREGRFFFAGSSLPHFSHAVPSTRGIPLYTYGMTGTIGRVFLYVILFLVFIFILNGGVVEKVHAVGDDADKMCLPEKVYTIECDKPEMVNGKSTGRLGGLNCYCQDITAGKVTAGLCIAANRCFTSEKTDPDIKGIPKEFTPSKEPLESGSPAGDTPGTINSGIPSPFTDPLKNAFNTSQNSGESLPQVPKESLFGRFFSNFFGDGALPTNSTMDGFIGDNNLGAPSGESGGLQPDGRDFNDFGAQNANPGSNNTDFLGVQNTFGGAQATNQTPPSGIFSSVQNAWGYVTGEISDFTKSLVEPFVGDTPALKPELTTVDPNIEQPPASQQLADEHVRAKALDELWVQRAELITNPPLQPSERIQDDYLTALRQNELSIRALEAGKTPAHFATEEATGAVQAARAQMATIAQQNGIPIENASRPDLADVRGKLQTAQDAYDKSAQQYDDFVDSKGIEYDEASKRFTVANSADAAQLQALGKDLQEKAIALNGAADAYRTVHVQSEYARLTNLENQLQGDLTRITSDPNLQSQVLLEQNRLAYLADQRAVTSIQESAQGASDYFRSNNGVGGINEFTSVEEISRIQSAAQAQIDQYRIDVPEYDALLNSAKTQAGEQFNRFLGLSGAVKAEQQGQLIDIGLQEAYAANPTDENALAIVENRARLQETRDLLARAETNNLTAADANQLERIAQGTVQKIIQDQTYYENLKYLNDNTPADRSWYDSVNVFNIGSEAALDRAFVNVYTAAAQTEHIDARLRDIAAGATWDYPTTGVTASIVNAIGNSPIPVISQALTAAGFPPESVYKEWEWLTPGQIAQEKSFAGALATIDGVSLINPSARLLSQMTKESIRSAIESVARSTDTIFPRRVADLGPTEVSARSFDFGPNPRTADAAITTARLGEDLGTTVVPDGLGSRFGANLVARNGDVVGRIESTAPRSGTDVSSVNTVRPAGDVPVSAPSGYRSFFTDFAQSNVGRALQTVQTGVVAAQAAVQAFVGPLAVAPVREFAAVAPPRIVQQVVSPTIAPQLKQLGVVINYPQYSSLPRISDLGAPPPLRTFDDLATLQQMARTAEINQVPRATESSGSSAIVNAFDTSRAEGPSVNLPRSDTSSLQADAIAINPRVPEVSSNPTIPSGRQVTISSAIPENSPYRIVTESIPSGVRVWMEGVIGNGAAAIRVDTPRLVYASFPGSGVVDGIRNFISPRSEQTGQAIAAQRAGTDQLYTGKRISSDEASKYIGKIYDTPDASMFSDRMCAGGLCDHKTPGIAHPNWPLGSEVHACNLNNGICGLVKVMDTGPAAWTKRTIDLNLAAQKAFRTKSTDLIPMRYRLISVPGVEQKLAVNPRSLLQGVTPANGIPQTAVVKQAAVSKSGSNTAQASSVDRPPSIREYLVKRFLSKEQQLPTPQITLKPQMTQSMIDKARSYSDASFVTSKNAYEQFAADYFQKTGMKIMRWDEWQARTQNQIGRQYGGIVMGIRKDTLVKLSASYNLMEDVYGVRPTPGLSTIRERPDLSRSQHGVANGMTAVDSFMPAKTMGAFVKITSHLGFQGINPYPGNYAPKGSSQNIGQVHADLGSKRQWFTTALFDAIAAVTSHMRNRGGVDLPIEVKAYLAGTRAPTTEVQVIGVTGGAYNVRETINRSSEGSALVASNPPNAPAGLGAASNVASPLADRAVTVNAPRQASEVIDPVADRWITEMTESNFPHTDRVAENVREALRARGLIQGNPAPATDLGDFIAFTQPDSNPSVRVAGDAEVPYAGSLSGEQVGAAADDAARIAAAQAAQETSLEASRTRALATLPTARIVQVAQKALKPAAAVPGPGYQDSLKRATQNLNAVKAAEEPLLKTLSKTRESFDGDRDALKAQLTSALPAYKTYDVARLQTIKILKEVQKQAGATSADTQKLRQAEIILNSSGAQLKNMLPESAFRQAVNSINITGDISAHLESINSVASDLKKASSDATGVLGRLAAAEDRRIAEVARAAAQKAVPQIREAGSPTVATNEGGILDARALSELEYPPDPPTFPRVEESNASPDIIRRTLDRLTPVEVTGAAALLGGIARGAVGAYVGAYKILSTGLGAAVDGLVAGTKNVAQSAAMQKVGAGARAAITDLGAGVQRAVTSAWTNVRAARSQIFPPRSPAQPVAPAAPIPAPARAPILPQVRAAVAQTTRSAGGAMVGALNTGLRAAASGVVGAYRSIRSLRASEGEQLSLPLVGGSANPPTSNKSAWQKTKENTSWAWKNRNKILAGGIGAIIGYNWLASNNEVKTTDVKTDANKQATQSGTQNPGAGTGSPNGGTQPGARPDEQPDTRRTSAPPDRSGGDPAPARAGNQSGIGSSLQNVLKALAAIPPSLWNALFGQKNNQAKPPVQSVPSVVLSANPTSVVSGTTSRLSWTGDNIANCTVYGPGSGVLTSGGASGAITTPALTRSTEFGIACSGLSGTSVTNSTVIVTVEGSTSTPHLVVFPENVTAALLSSQFYQSQAAGGSQGGSGGAQTGTGGSSEAPVVPKTSGHDADGNQVSAWCDPNQSIETFTQCLCRLEPTGCRPWRQ